VEPERDVEGVERTMKKRVKTVFAGMCMLVLGMITGAFWGGSWLAAAAGVGEWSDGIELPTWVDPNVRMVAIEDLEATDQPGWKGLAIAQGEYPLVYLIIDESGKLTGVALADGEKGHSVMMRLNQDGRIRDIGVFGNKVHDGVRMPVFTFDASDTPGVWHKTMYMPAVKAVKEGGKVVNYKAIGELYEDIDFDGSFDAKRLYDEESEIIAYWIYIGGQWLELGRRVSGDAPWDKLGYYDSAERTAVQAINNKKYNYHFEIGKGWKRGQK
jgi:hypothetical protein